MAYSEELEKQIDSGIEAWGVEDKRKMFGGICYLVNGNMCFGIWKDFLIVRCGQETAEEKLKENNVHPFDITGRAMKGWVMVAEEGWKKDKQLSGWLEMGRDFALSLPAKVKN